jgi:hypothetical protein
MKTEDYYLENYPDGKPWDELTRAEQKAIRKTRRRENWENIKETVEDIGDFIDLFLMVFGARK